jgi:hypothetical protein
LTKPSTKYGRLVIEADAYLRSTCSNGTRVQVNYQELAEKLECPASNMSAALLALSQIQDSGLRRVKGGVYEYKTPEHYPRELEELKKFVRNPPKATTRSHLMSEVVVHLREKYGPGEVITANLVAEELDARPGSVSNVFLKLVELAVLETTNFKGTYRVRQLPGRSEFAVPASGPQVIIDDLSGMQAATVDNAVEDTKKPVTPADVASRVASVQARVEKRLYKEISETKDGKIVVQAPDGRLYTLEEL